MSTTTPATIARGAITVMLEWLGKSAALLSCLSVIVTLASRWAAAREKNFHERTVSDLKAWNETPDAQYYWRGYLKKLEE